MDPLFFESAHELRNWFESFHLKEKELWVGLYKKESGKASISWEEVKDLILCFGWAEGKIRPLNAKSYAIRLTPRKKNSRWSLKNVQKALALIDMGLMEAAGVKAFEERDRKYEADQAQNSLLTQLDPALEEKLQASPKAFHFFEQTSPSYKKTAIRWVMSAKQEATRHRRLQSLIESSEEGLKIPPMR